MCDLSTRKCYVLNNIDIYIYSNILCDQSSAKYNVDMIKKNPENCR